MAKNKTMENSLNVNEFLNTLKEDKKRTDSLGIIELISKQTGIEPKMWGSSIIGFGSYHYRYESGHEGEAPIIAFSPRASAITLYLSSHFENREELLEKLGKHKTGKGCIYINSIDNVNIEILEKMVVNHINYIKTMYPVKQEKQ